MIRKLLLVALLVTGMCVAANAETSTRSGIVLDENMILGRDGHIMVIETTGSFVPQALDNLGEGYDYFSGADFSALDLSTYDHVFLCMDGGLVEAPSIANIAAFAEAGGCLHIFGGTCYEAYAIAVNDYLIGNNTADYCWTISGMPHTEVIAPGHYLAEGLPAEYNFANNSAAYYSLRITDDGGATAAVNGDGYALLFAKPIGEGSVDICINSAYALYWEDAGDWAWGEQVVANMLNCEGTVATENSSWSNIKAQYR